METYLKDSKPNQMRCGTPPEELTIPTQGASLPPILGAKAIRIDPHIFRVVCPILPILSPKKPPKLNYNFQSTLRDLERMLSFKIQSQSIHPSIHPSFYPLRSKPNQANPSFLPNTARPQCSVLGRFDQPYPSHCVLFDSF